MSSFTLREKSTSDAVLDSRAQKRIQRELEKFREDSLLDPTLRLSVQSSDVWLISFTGAIGTLYAGENFTLRIRFTSEYPMDSPEVIFLPPAPVHEHIYSNGHICLNILGEDWSPALTARSICLSILSMLSSATVKVLPEGNDRYVSRPNTNPKKTRFLYHDDTV